MRSPQPPPLNSAQRVRLVAMTLTAVFWLAVACLDTLALGAARMRKTHARAFRQLARQAALLTFVRAAEFAGRHRYDRTQQVYGAKRRRQQILRALVGVRMRRFLRHRDPLTRVALLMQAFTQFDTNARRLQHRLRAGLTRAWGQSPTPQAAEALADTCAPALAITDTS